MELITYSTSACWHKTLGVVALKMAHERAVHKSGRQNQNVRKRVHAESSAPSNGRFRARRGSKRFLICFRLGARVSGACESGASLVARARAFDFELFDKPAKFGRGLDQLFAQPSACRRRRATCSRPPAPRPRCCCVISPLPLRRFADVAGHFVGGRVLLLDRRGDRVGDLVDLVDDVADRRRSLRPRLWCRSESLRSCG